MLFCNFQPKLYLKYFEESYLFIYLKIVKELCKHMEVNITGTEKNLLSCPDAAVVEAQNFIDKVAIETRFPY